MKRQILFGIVFSVLFLIFINPSEGQAHLLDDFENLEHDEAIELLDSLSSDEIIGLEDYYGSDITILNGVNSTNPFPLSNNLLGFMPLAVLPCPYGNGICDAVKRGDAKVYSSSGKLQFFGSAFQCIKCKTVYATEHDLGVPIGKWVAQSTNYDVSLMTIIYSDYVKTTSSLSIPGVTRRYAS